MQTQVIDPSEERNGGWLNSYLTPPYSAFLPLIVVFGVLLAVNSIQLWNNWEQKAALNNELHSLRKELPRAKLVNARMLQLSEDLVRLGATSPAAQQIVRDFNIRLAKQPPAKP